MKKLNVLYIMADQYNANCLGYFNKGLKTPHLDRLAQEGVLFTHAYCNNPVCGPSRISFITGQYPHTHRIFSNNIYDMEIPNSNTLPAIFRKAGFQTAIIGKSHMIGRWDREGFEYIRYCDLIDCDSHDPLKNHYFKHLYDNGIAHLYDHGVLKEGHDGAGMKGFVSPIEDKYSLETWTGDRALEFLDSRDNARPFFMHLGFQRPHEPLSIPCDRELLYKPDDIELPENAADFFERGFEGKPELMRGHVQRYGKYPYIPESKEDLKRQLAFYYTLITTIDTQIGRVIKKLQDSGEYDNTIIVFTADHGDFAGEHGMMFKNIGIYESIHRIPFILRYPGAEESKRIDDIIESVDMYPTLCELCGVELPDCVEGKSLLPVIEEKTNGKQYTVCEWEFVHYKNKVTAIRTPDYRMVYYNQDELGELYDVGSDPGEINNLYKDPRYKDTRIDLLQKMFDHVAQYRVDAKFNDCEQQYRIRNCFTRLLQVGQKNWNEIELLYKV